MFSPRKSGPYGQQGSMFSYVRSSQQPPAPSAEDESSDDGVDEVPARAPTANMTRPPYHFTTKATSAEEPTDSQRAEAALRADVERVNDEQEARDEDFTPAPPKRKSEVEIGPSKKTKTNPSPAKPYEQCCVAIRAERDELITRIGKIWSADHTSWPTHPFAPARASVILEPREWGKPILQKVEELSRAANNKESASAALSNAVGNRKTTAGERIWMTTNHIDAAITKLLSKERVRSATVPAPDTTDVDEDNETARPATADTANDLNAMTSDEAQAIPRQSLPLHQVSAQPQNTRAKQDARIKAVLESIRHLDTQTLRNVACHMIDVANLRDEHESDLKKKEAALTLACSSV